MDEKEFQEKAAEALTDWLPSTLPNSGSQGGFYKHLFQPNDVLVWWTHGSIAKPPGTPSNELDEETRFVNLIVDCKTDQVADTLKTHLGLHDHRLQLADKLKV